MTRKMSAIFLLANGLQISCTARGVDQSGCVTAADCDEECTELAASSGMALAGFDCRPDLCACGLLDDQQCYVGGGVVGEPQRVDCPVTEATIASVVDATLQARDSQ